jgi:hypothetical protein
MSPKRQVLTLVATTVFAGAVVAGAVPTARGTATAVGKPVIGKPVTVPAQPLAGKRFTVSFEVTRAGTGAPLIAGKMICDPSIAGQVVAHAESFKSGTARLSFVVPATAAGKVLTVKLTIKAGSRSTTKVTTFHVQGASLPSLSIGDITAAEGNAGTTTFSFPVALSTASTRSVSVSYATADGTATAPSDYSTASGTLTFQPGETAKTITVSVVGDVAIEPNETFTVALSNPGNATIARATATGAITNDDTAVPVTPGAYKGATQEGNYIFFTVLSNRMLTGIRANAFAETCEPAGLTIRGSINTGTRTYVLGNDGRFTISGSWAGSEKDGDAEWTNETFSFAGLFATPTSANGTITIGHELNYDGVHYRCSSGSVTWSATFQG